jgi:hypothetical protein
MGILLLQLKRATIKLEKQNEHQKFFFLISLTYMNMKMNVLDFVTNVDGILNQILKARLQAVIDGPCEESWENTYNIILNKNGNITLWQAVSFVDPGYLEYKLDAVWGSIPLSNTILNAIRFAVFDGIKEKIICKDDLENFYTVKLI